MPSIGLLLDGQAIRSMFPSRHQCKLKRRPREVGERQGREIVGTLCSMVR